jgi:hypothetical protein
MYVMHWQAKEVWSRFEWKTSSSKIFFSFGFRRGVITKESKESGTELGFLPKIFYLGMGTQQEPIL